MSNFMLKRIFILVLVVCIAAVLVTFMLTRNNVDTVRPATAEPINMETAEQTQEQPKQPEQPENPAEPEVPQAQDSAVNAEIYESSDHSVIICFDKNTGEILWERRTGNTEEVNSEESAPENVETVEESPVVETADDTAESAELQALIEAGVIEAPQEPEVPETEAQEPETQETETQETENQEAPVTVVVVDQPQVETEQSDSEEITEEETIEETVEEEQVSLSESQSYVVNSELAFYPGSAYSSPRTLSAGDTITVVQIGAEFTMVELTYKDAYRETKIIAYVNTAELLAAI